MAAMTDGSTLGNAMLNSTTLSSEAVWAETAKFLKISDRIWDIGLPSLLVLGLVGNVMVILIMRRFSESTLTIFFQVLAWSDLLALITSVLPLWLRSQFGVPYIENLGSVPCKLTKLIAYTTGVLSPWTLVVLTMQRAASVLWPHRINAMWTKRKSRIVAWTLILVTTLIHSQFLFVIDISKDLCSTAASHCCFVQYRWFYFTVWPWLDLLEFSLLPSLLLIVSNSVLLSTLITSRSRFLQQHANQESRQKKVSSLTVILMTVSASFFLLTTPMPVCMILEPYVLPTGHMDQLLTAKYGIFWTTSTVLWYANSAINFYLYCLTGKKFRAEFQNIMMKFFSLVLKTQNTKAKQAHLSSSAVMSS